ncbi:MAG: hypothetical protein IPN53_26130 [Comamonadaceae bacterium]|nr:hypothetical protein [Comamonadaceae bacterium]
MKQGESQASAPRHRLPPNADRANEDQAQRVGGFDHKGVQVLQTSPGQLVSCLSKTTISYATLPVAVNRQATKEGVEHDLL